MIQNLPNLAFLPVEKLVIHEWHDDQRTPSLIELILASGVFRNPPIVAPLLDNSGRYMVLDGANRTTALKQMGYPHALVQIVHPKDSGLTLLNWNHVVWGIKPSEIQAGIDSIADIDLTNTEYQRPDLWGDCGLAMVQLPRGDLFTVCTAERELLRRVELLNALVDSYKDRAYLDRTSEWSVVRLKAVYKNLSGLVIFPRFDIDHVLQLAGCRPPCRLHLVVHSTVPYPGPPQSRRAISV